MHIGRKNSKVIFPPYVHVISCEEKNKKRFKVIPARSAGKIFNFVIFGHKNL